MPTRLAFDALARVPSSSDNVAIATRCIEAGTQVLDGDACYDISHCILEGHRFARVSIGEGQELLSWGLPFGLACGDISPGSYVCNEKIIRALRLRKVDFTLPDKANFSDYMRRYALNESNFVEGTQVPVYAETGFFEGFARPASRGVGTRNFLVVLATNAPSSGFARQLVEKLQPIVQSLAGLDGVVSVTHTEGGGQATPNNLAHVLRTLAGFVVHPNVGAVLCVDTPGGAFDNRTLLEFANRHDYPLADVLHAFVSIGNDVEEDLKQAADVLTAWLPEVANVRRSKQPLSALKLALQCGGSDAFSGVSGNALAGYVAKQLIRHGGSANLAETDELIGAEPYVLANVRSLQTAEAFLEKIENFKRYAAHHGTTAEGNPSGGNNFRGLYNIALKSIGAARKKDPDVRLDYVIDYAQPMREGGFYFMDSPGNDLESIAGQVAAGANLIIFITGNGSITNFPFVPTLKFVTTSGRFQLLANEMDVNAGRYNDGLSMTVLGEETFSLMCDVASGATTKGELAGHSQVSIWRDWPQTDGDNLQTIKHASKPDGIALKVCSSRPAQFTYDAYQTDRGYAIDQVALVMPTSLCSGQPARLIAEHLTDNREPDDVNRRYCALVHTEGCGSNNTAPILLRTLLGYITHQSVRSALLLEHGCEHTHNDTVQQYLNRAGVDAERFGWASVQLDGGLLNVQRKSDEFFSRAGCDEVVRRTTLEAGELTIALTSTDLCDDRSASLLSNVVRGLVNAGGTVVLPSNAPLLGNDVFRVQTLMDTGSPKATLAYGQRAQSAGLHVMDAPTEDMTETLTGLGATGVDLMLLHLGRAPVQAHPLIPLLQFTSDAAIASRFTRDLDFVIHEDKTMDAQLASVFEHIAATASLDYLPKFQTRGIHEFQLARGLLGLSM